MGVHQETIKEDSGNGLHPSRAANLLDILKSLGAKRNIDVLITTHNPALLDAAGHKMIPFVFSVHRDSRTGISKWIETTGKLGRDIPIPKCFN